MSYREMAKELKKHIEVMTNTFEANNLKLEGMSCRACAEDDGDLSVYVELASIQGSSIPADVRVKINLYDADGEIYMTGEESLYEEDFAGYDTLELQCFDDCQTLDIAKSGKLYVVR